MPTDPRPSTPWFLTLRDHLPGLPRVVLVVSLVVLYTRPGPLELGALIAFVAWAAFDSWLHRPDALGARLDALEAKVARLGNKVGVSLER